jgi:hypothetical protein
MPASLPGKVSWASADGRQGNRAFGAATVVIKREHIEIDIKIFSCSTEERSLAYRTVRMRFRV